MEGKLGKQANFYLFFCGRTWAGCKFCFSFCNLAAHLVGLTTVKRGVQGLLIRGGWGGELVILFRIPIVFACDGFLVFAVRHLDLATKLGECETLLLRDGQSSARLSRLLSR